MSQRSILYKTSEGKWCKTYDPKNVPFGSYFAIHKSYHEKEDPDEFSFSYVTVKCELGLCYMFILNEKTKDILMNYRNAEMYP